MCDRLATFRLLHFVFSYLLEFHGPDPNPPTHGQTIETFLHVGGGGLAMRVFE